MPLVTETYTLDEALVKLEEHIEEIADELEPLDQSTDRAQALIQQANRLEYLCDGLVWQRDEAEWGGDCELELGGLTAAERALMDREKDDHAGDEETVLWFVAAGTESAPYAADTLSETFANLADAHPAFIEWAQRTIDGLMTPGETGNRLQRYLQESDSEVTSTETANSTTSSQSPSGED